MSKRTPFTEKKYSQRYNTSKNELYQEKDVVTTSQFHDKLFDLGFNVGMRMLELICIREKECGREITVDNVVSFIAKDMWRILFGYQVDIGRVRGKPNEFLITDKGLIVTEFICSDKRGFYCVSYVAGIAQACLDGFDFKGNVGYGEDDDGPYLHIVFQN
ncbi:Transport protein particle subunit trs31 [Entamoeba marina]